MSLLNTDAERPAVYLDRYAAELAEWRQDIVTVRAAQSVPEELNTNPKDRALFARISSVLAEYARTGSQLGRQFGQ